MKTKICILLLLFSFVSIAQQGVNYKALIKDDIGNIVSNQSINIQFTLLQSHLQTQVYQETHNVTTNHNGLVNVIIGTGNTTDLFHQVNWSAGELLLNVQIDIGNGLTDLSTTEFQFVPYAYVSELAIEAMNVTGLEKINEGNGVGWRLEGVVVDGEEGYGTIGNNATDLSVTNIFGVQGLYPYGATGASSFATGTYTIAYGDYTTSLGYATIASENYSTALGRSTHASAIYSTALGRSTDAEAYNSTAIGRYNIGGGNPNTWIENDPLFEIGNGTLNTKNNALTVYKSGLHSINSSSSGLNIYAMDNGISMSAGNDGITISSDNNGIVISAENSGARISGDSVGVYASGGHLQSDVPDIILGSSSNSLFSDDGIISTNPLRAGSDMFLRSYDAVVVHLDYDNNEAGNFRIRNGTEDIVFDVSESGNVSVNGSVVHSSDKRLKTNIEDLSYGLNEILKLQPKQYFWKKQEQQKKSLGLIAQDVQPIINEIVNTQDDDAKTLGISYTELIPVLINAIKEQQKIIDGQKLENQQQRAAISELQLLSNRVKQLETLLEVKNN